MSKDIYIKNKIKVSWMIDLSDIELWLDNLNERKTEDFYIIANDNKLEGL